MQNSSATGTPSLHGARTTPVLVAVLLLALSLMSVPSIAAQDATPGTGTPAAATPTSDATPAATPGAEAVDTLGTVLMTHDFEEMPPAPLTVRLLRITLEPGASSPMHTHPGPEFNLVESGTLTANIDGTAIVGIGGESSEVTGEQSLGIGQWIMYPAGTGMNLINEGDENLVMLSAVIHPVGADVESTITYADGEPSPEDFEGVSFVVLGDGLIQQLPAGGATVTVDRLTVGAGEPIPGYSGPALLSKTAGDFAIRVGDGNVQVTRTATPQLQGNAIPEQEFTLADNDAAFFPSGYETIERSDDSGELVFTRLLIQPEGDQANAPAAVATIDTGSTETVETTDESPGNEIGIGAIIAINEDTVNVRAEATTDSDIVDTYQAGTRFEIVGGPVEGEDYIWYEVVGVGDLSDVQGWLVTDFMDVIDAAPGGSVQQSDDGSSGSDGTQEESGQDIFDIDLSGIEESSAPPINLEVGAIVQTTEDNLRIRSDPNAGGDIIVAVPTGTGLEVIGGPEQADNFTWYEVQLTDDEEVSGWVASDFLEVVEESGS